MPRKSTRVTSAKTAKDTDKKVSENLRKIYENPDGSMPDMSTIDRRPGGQWWRVLVRSVVVVGVIAVGMWAWDSYINPRLHFENELAVDLSGPNQVSPGAETEYTIRYRNPGVSEIKEATLYLEHPTDFVITKSSKPLEVDGSKIKLGALRGNEGGEVIVSGVWGVDYGTTSTLSALLSYIPANFSSVFEKESSLEVVANQSKYQFAWTAPATVSAGKQTTVALTIKSALPFTPDLALQIVAPNDFSVTSMEPKSTELSGYEWRLPTSTNSFTVNVKGMFNTSGTEPFVAVVRGVVSSTSANFSRILARSIQSTSVDLIEYTAAKVTVLGKEDMVSAAPGTILPIKLVVKNSSANVLNNGTIVLNITAPSYQNKSILNWQKFIDKYDGQIKGDQINLELRRGVITWTGKEIKELHNLKPGETFALDVSIPIKNGNETTLSNFASSTILISAELRDNGFLIGASDPVVVNITSDTAFSAKAERSESTYKVTWLLNNSFHELKDVRVEGDLYGNFSWNQSAASVPVGTIVFDPKTKKIVWGIPTLPVNVDAAALKFPLVFEKINPTQQELSSVIKLTATDAETGDVITLSAPAIKAQ